MTSLSRWPMFERLSKPQGENHGFGDFAEARDHGDEFPRSRSALPTERTEMRTHIPTITKRDVLVALILPLLALALTGCGVGPASDKEKISKTATTYLRALGDGDTVKACAQLTRRAKGEECKPALKRRLGRLDRDALKHAADGSLEIDLHGQTATAGLPEPSGARFVLAKVGRAWRIDSGYTLGLTLTATIPATPVGKQVAWALAQLNGGAARLTQAEVSARFSPQFLAVVMPARAIVALLGQTAEERGPFTFAGFAYPPTATQAVALIETKGGEGGSLRVKVERSKPARIVGLEVDDAPPTISASGRYSGRFDIGGRKLFLYCTGTGSPTVVFEGGLTTDWVPVQNQVARFTRACSYDPALGARRRIDLTKTPRTPKDVVADLHALLAAAKVPGPHPPAGHSAGGLC